MDKEAVRKLLPQLKSKALVFHSSRDELVSPRSLAVLKDCPAFTVAVLPMSGHFYYEESELLLLQKAFEDLLKGADQ